MAAVTQDAITQHPAPGVFDPGASLDPNACPSNGVQPGCIMFLEKNGVEGMNKIPHFPPPDALGHPVIVLVMKRDVQVAVVVTTTSLGGMSLAGKYPTESVKRRKFLPIYPSDPHPDTGDLLHLENNCLSKPSCVRMKNVYVVPLSLLSPIRTGTARITDESLSLLIDSVPQRWRDKILGADKPRGETSQILDAETHHSDAPEAILDAEEPGWLRVNYASHSNRVALVPPAPEPVRYGRIGPAWWDEDVVFVHGEHDISDDDLRYDGNEDMGSHADFVGCEDGDASVASLGECLDDSRYDEEHGIDSAGRQEVDEKETSTKAKKKRRRRRNARRIIRDESSTTLPFAVLFYLLLLLIFIMYALCELFLYMRVDSE